MILLEISVGQFLGQGAAHTWRASPIFKGKQQVALSRSLWACNRWLQKLPSRKLCNPCRTTKLCCESCSRLHFFARLVILKLQFVGVLHKRRLPQPAAWGGRAFRSSDGWTHPVYPHSEIVSVKGQTCLINYRRERKTTGGEREEELANFRHILWSKSKKAKKASKADKSKSFWHEPNQYQHWEKVDATSLLRLLCMQHKSNKTTTTNYYINKTIKTTNKNKTTKV